MMAERKHRTSKEVTGDILAKRLNNTQLVGLLDRKEFVDYHPKIIEKLQGVDNIGLDSFRKVHSSPDCKIEETDTKYDVRVRILGPRIDLVPLKIRKCTKHQASSIPFYNYYGDINEGSFRRSREVRESSE